MNELVEHQYELMNIPTRSEIDTMQRRQQENRRENRQLRDEIQRLRVQLDRLSQSGRMASAQPASKSKGGGKAKSPAQDRLPIEDTEDDLTLIKGIGPKMMEKLYAQGITNFAKLARMNTRFAEELDETLKAQGRILRDDWIGQAKKLLG
jgi:predicted flap endonuclease-1-like 5' DNA nuclease